MIKIKRTFILIFLLSSGFAYFQGDDFPYAIFYIMLCILLFSLLTIIVNGKLINIKVKKENSVLSTSDTIKFKMTVNNYFLITSFLKLENNTLLKLNKNYVGDFTNIGLTNYQSFNYSVTLNKRGIYDFSNIKLTIHDIFFVSSLIKNITNNDIIKVYPKIVNVGEIINNCDDGQNRTVKINMYKDDMYSTKESRKYVYGDSIKKINWKVSSRYNELYVKSYDSVASNDLNIILDMSNSVYDFDKSGDLEEIIISYCASIINYYVKEKVNINLFVNNVKDESFKISNNQEFINLMDYFIENFSLGNVKMAPYLEEKCKVIPFSSTIIIITYKILKDMIPPLISMKNKRANIIIYYFVGDENQNEVLELENLYVICKKINIKESL